MRLLKGHRDNRKRRLEREKRWSHDQPHIHSLSPSFRCRWFAHSYISVYYFRQRAGLPELIDSPQYFEGEITFFVSFVSVSPSGLGSRIVRSL